MSWKVSGLGGGIWVRIREAKFSFEVLCVILGFLRWEEVADVGKALLDAGLSGDGES